MFPCYGNLNYILQAWTFEVRDLRVEGSGFLWRALSPGRKRMIVQHKPQDMRILFVRLRSSVTNTACAGKDPPGPNSKRPEAGLFQTRELATALEEC